MILRVLVLAHRCCPW